MPPRAKAATRAGADDSEDDLATAALQSGAENKRNTTKMPKAKAAARRASAGKPATKRKAAPKTTRTALKDRTNLQEGNETEEVDEFDDDEMGEAAKPKAKRTKTTNASRKNASEKTGEPAKPKRGRPQKRAPSPEHMMTIPETQPDPENMEDVEQSIEVDPENMDIEKEPTPKQKQIWYQRAPSAPVQLLQPRASSRVEPLQPRPSARAIRAGSAQPGYGRERSGSASGTERRGGDPELRRQLNDLTRKYEDLQLKHEGLQEIGKNQADTNFERLKRASDQKAKDANELIASLKKELAEVRKNTSSSSSESTGLQKQIITLTTANEKLTADRDDLKSRLQVSQNEIKSMDAKLIAARQQISNSAAEAKAQEAASKKLNNNIAMPGNIGDSAKEAKMKENLYADLTGLLIRAVKRKEGEDEYDCLQTGRNGSKFPLPLITPDPSLTNFGSSTLPPLHRQRHLHTTSKDTQRPLLRRRRIRLRTTAGREPGSRAIGLVA